MGLFDNYYSPEMYQDSGGLFGRIASMLGVQAQYQPGAGFPQSPMDANAAMPAPAPTLAPQQSQNAPINVGGYSMPRIGSGFPSADAMPQSSAVMQPPAAAPQPGIASLLQPQPAEGGLGAAFRGALANANNGPLGLILGGIAGAAGMGQGTPQQQQARTLNLRFQALQQAGIPKDRALLAAIDPEGYGKKIIDEAFGGSKYSFAQLPDGTIVKQDPRTGAVAPAYQGAPKADFGVIGKGDDGTERYGFIDKNKRTVQPLDAGGEDDRTTTVTGPNGQPIAVPPGADRKTFVREVTKANADAATGKMTEVQAKASSFATRMEQAEAALRPIEGEGTSYVGRGLDALPIIGGTATTNSMHSVDYQKYRQAASTFITAMLRQESGAAISKEEFNRYEKELMPQPGDSPEVLTQKRAARWAAVEQMRKAAGPGYRSPSSGAPSADGAPSSSSSTGITRSGVKWSIE